MKQVELNKDLRYINEEGVVFTWSGNFWTEPTGDRVKPSFNWTVYVPDLGEGMINASDQMVKIPLSELRLLLTASPFNEVKEQLIYQISHTTCFKSMEEAVRMGWNRIQLGANLQAKCPVGRR